MTKDEMTYIFYMMMLALLAIFFITEAYMEMNKPRFGHSTGIIVVLGIIVSAVIYEISL